jgi:hypothetical protein
MTHWAVRRGTLVLLAAGVICALVPGIPAALRAVFTLPLVALFPGLAVMEAVSPGRPRFPERLLLGVALSFAIAMLGALLLHWSGLPVDAGAWAGLLAGVTIVAGAAAAGGGNRLTAATLFPRVGWGRTAVLAMVALAVTAGALALARSPLRAEGVQGYTALWVLPPREGSKAVRIGVRSAEVQPVHYRLAVRRSGRVRFERTIRLSPGEVWRQGIRMREKGSGSGRVEALLYKQGRSSPYRRVDLALPNRGGRSSSGGRSS